VSETVGHVERPVNVHEIAGAICRQTDRHALYTTVQPAGGLYITAIRRANYMALPPEPTD